MFVPNFQILGTVVPEKSLTKKKVYTQTHTHTEKAKTIYPLYTSYTGGIIIHYVMLCYVMLCYVILCYVLFCSKAILNANSFAEFKIG